MSGSFLNNIYMPFKKSNIKKQKSLIIPNIVWLVSLSIIFLLWFILINSLSFLNLNIDEKESLNPTNQNKQENNELIENLEKEENKKDKTNILLVWRWWWDHDAPNLTDTIILASINTKTKVISMLSIPRDLYVDYPEDDENWKINWLYAQYRFENNSQSVGMEILKTKISEITWEEIDYFVNIDFNWFKEIIDTIWWIEITIPQNFVDEQYPDWNWWYKTLVFKKWTWIFDWENALKYARSRHSTSDFDRSLRQQQVIKSIKEKLTWSYFLTSPWKIKELYEVFVNHVYTDITLTTLIKFAYQLNSSDDYTILSSNLNDSCFYWSSTCSKWGFLYVPSREFFWWMSVLLIEWTNVEKLSNYDIVQDFTNIVFNYPELFIENYKVNIFNSLKINNLAWALSNDIIRYWFNIPEYNSIWNTKEIYPNSIIYYNNIEEDSITLKILKKFFDWEIKKVEAPIYSNDAANIEIIIWEDYLWDNSPFKF